MRDLMPAPFPDDDGGRSAALVTAFTAYSESPSTGFAPLIAMLQDARVLVPVVAVLGEVEYDENGMAHDKTSDMAAVSITGADGRNALLAFTCTETMNEWDPKARPVPVTFRQAAQAALHDGAEAVVVDLASVMVAVEGDVLMNLAAGNQLVRAGTEWGWMVADPNTAM
ncbi:MAG TPA: SseB family protein [Marmoricola sp.]|nr:SseB family protein [Marmoricola sp.]HNI70648.1 SseB family protein [Marmoricola sp.]HNJ78057.1 SseB family protein [Marmoricola sp.]